jgi:hypothetical protein
MNRPMQIAAAAIVAVLAGCATKGYEKSESAAAAARTTKTAVATLATQTQACLVSMGTLFGQPYQDLPARFERFSKDVDGLSSANTRLASSVSSLERTVDARFRSWDAENATFANRELRTHAEKRRDEVFATWQQAQGPMDKGVAFAGAVSGQFADLRKLLSNDLTPGGVEAATGFADKARAEAEKVVESTKAWSDGLDAAIQALSTGPTSAPAPATAPPAK